jgi:hypothetical protein
MNRRTGEPMDRRNGRVSSNAECAEVELSFGAERHRALPQDSIESRVLRFDPASFQQF